MDSISLDRLAVLTISGSQANLLMEQLHQAGFHFTVIHTTGGVIQDADICMLVGFRREQQSTLMDLVREKCQPYRQYVSAQGFLPLEPVAPSMLEAKLGGALFCMMDVERFEQI